MYYKTLCPEIGLIYSKHCLVNDRMVNLTRECPNVEEMKITLENRTLKPSSHYMCRRYCGMTQIQEILKQYHLEWFGLPHA